jgi:hypothetical protein
VDEQEFEKTKDVPAAALEEKIANWRRSFVKDYNDNFVGKSFLDPNVAASMIKSLTDDVHVLFQWCEVLAYKVKKLEEG